MRGRKGVGRKGSRRKRPERVFKVLNDSDYGFTEGDEIFINIQRIWEENPVEDLFAFEFGRTHTHELLHLILEPVGSRIVWEEKIIRNILKEPWDDALEVLYELDD